MKVPCTLDSGQFFGKNSFIKEYLLLSQRSQPNPIKIREDKWLPETPQVHISSTFRWADYRRFISKHVLPLEVNFICMTPIFDVSVPNDYLSDHLGAG
jgi:hypothetical protein